MDEKAHKCDKCGYASASPAVLKWHQLKRHGSKEQAKAKRFACDSCDYRAVHYSELNNHTRAVHRKEWRFRCDKAGCNYGTYQTYRFKNHLLAHEDDPKKRFPLVCTFPGCDFRRMVRPEMKAHERNHKISKLKLKCGTCGRGNYPDIISLNFHNRLNHFGRAYRGLRTSAPAVPVVRLERICVKVI